MNKIIAAKLETRNFEFVAYSTDSGTAKKLLKNAFIAHINHANGSLAWIEVEIDIRFEEIILNTVVIS
jgi:hypothetical protein